MPSSPLYTCSDMARALRRNVTSIWRAVQRLKIKHVSSISNGTVKLYDAQALETISNEMRRPNSKQSKGGRP